MAKALGYRSYGHFESDFNMLKEAGYIKEDGNYIQITNEGKRDFIWVEAFKVLPFFISIITILYFYLFISLQLNLKLYPFVFLVGGIIGAISTLITTYFVYSSLLILPKEAQELMRELGKLR